MMPMYELITPKRFADLLQTKNLAQRVIPIDSTWFLPNLNRNGKNEFLAIERIPGSVYFDIDAIKDDKSEYSHMAPPKNVFDKSMSQLGIRKDDILVVYDRIGNFSAPRCAWTLALFSHSPVYLLNNFNIYKKEGYPIETEVRTKLTDYEPTNYVSSVDLSSNQIVTYETMLDLVETGQLAKKYNVYDARPNGRYRGVDPEPRPGMPSGHIPGVQSLPFLELLTPDTKQFPSTSTEIKAKVEEAMSKVHSTYDPEKPTIVMCGTGVTAVVVKTALEQSGIKDVKLYDGSWTEWVLRADPKYIETVKS